jgi:glucose-1-phosphate adenylyltransferase
MGVYVFTTEALIRRVLEDAKNPGSAHDFGRNIIPGMISQNRVLAYPLPGLGDAAPYWRDIGTLDSYWEASMDLLRPIPQPDLFSGVWPVRTFREQRPPSMVADDGVHGAAKIRNCLISQGTVITSASVTHSIIALDNVVYPGAEIEDSVFMSRVCVREGARIRRAIIDKDVDVPAGETIGYDLERDNKRFHVTDGGVVVVPRGYAFV